MQTPSQSGVGFIGIRERLNRNRKTVGALVGVVVLLACGVVVYYETWIGRRPGDGDVNLSFYTTDDGKTWFQDDVRKIPPFQRDGVTAYRCRVFTCDGGKTQFVAYLERYAPEAQAQAQSQPLRPDPLKAASMIEVKPPGTGNQGWVKSGDPKALAITTPMCSDGTRPVPVTP